ncbi:MAG: ABC transporter substrate-binding protein [Thermoproteota archaeon]|nr:ABC transporter substrate-binding protein [Thermoproteota archaeon]
MRNTIKFGISAAIFIGVIASSSGIIPAGPSLGLGKGVVGSGNENSNDEGGSGGTIVHGREQQQSTLRIGYFPNINHAAAVIGLGRGDFQKILGDNGIVVKTQLFSAGPSAIEALFANQIDVAYVGPNPAINGYVQSKGEALRIISGAASGGAVFVVRNDAGINSPQDLANKKFASPQLGNTQDVALRKYLLEHGYKTNENGGNVEVIPAKTADIVTLMLKKEIDGAWVPEPWGAKLVKEANAKILVDERDLWPAGQFVSAHIIARTDYLENNPQSIKALLQAHLNETSWINNNPDEALHVFNGELYKLTGNTIPEDEYREGISRLKLTYDPIKQSLFKSANDAFDIGFLGEGSRPDLSKIYDLSILNEILRERGMQQIQ